MLRARPWRQRSCLPISVFNADALILRMFSAANVKLPHPTNTEEEPARSQKDQDNCATQENRDQSRGESSRRYSPFLCDADSKKVIDRMIRVDHAGEVGARQIYAGQLTVFEGTRVGSVIQRMAAQEQKHLDAFNHLITSRRVRPTVMMPIWNVAGYALGLSTALLGKEAAMACTVAVEEVIAEHYNDQVRTLLQEGWEDEEALRATFREFRDDELEHKDTGIEHDAERAPLYKALSAVIKAGCRGAIFITERV